MSQKRRVVVTGIGILCPLGTTLKESWTNLILGHNGLTKLDEPEYSSLPCKVSAYVKENGKRIQLAKHFTKSELKSMAPATAFALLAANEAITDANLLERIVEEEKLRTGVAVGMGMVDLHDVCSTYDGLKKGYHHISPFFVPRILPNMAGGQISIKYGFHGPNHSVSTACATGAHAIGDSYRFIRDGYADCMISGGTECCISVLSIAGFCRMRALSTNFNEQPERASRPFDKKRDGFVMGEGSAIIVLEELQHALNRQAPKIYAEILGYGLSGDASHLTAPRADGEGAYLAMKRAVKDAQLDTNDISYVNAHATSTPMGDAVEIRAIQRLFNEHLPEMAISSTKGAHGHLLGAAGNLEAAFTIQAIHEATIPPTINLEESEWSDINLVPNKCQKWNNNNNKRRVALKNAFGFGGTNASLCIAQYIN